MWQCISIVAISLAIFSPAYAGGSQTGNSLLDYCQSPSGTPGWGVCRGYISGVLDALQAEEAVLQRPTLFCIPHGATVGQLADVAIQFLDQNPGKRHLDAASIIWTGMIKAFPCSPTH
jgi:hypothetical protein